MCFITQVSKTAQYFQLRSILSHAMSLKAGSSVSRTSKFQTFWENKEQTVSSDFQMSPPFLQIPIMKTKWQLKGDTLSRVRERYVLCLQSLDVFVFANVGCVWTFNLWMYFKSCISKLIRLYFHSFPKVVYRISSWI